MKKLILAAILGILVPVALFAATNNVPTASPISILTAAQVLTSTPTYSGQVIICSGCTTSTLYTYQLCVGTETATAGNAYVMLGSSAALVTACK